MSNKKENYDLTTGSVAGTLVSFALPFLFSNFMQAFYGAADLFVVGRYAGSSAVSAVTIGSQLMYIVTSIILGLSMGTTVMLGRRMGERDDKGLAKVLGNTVWIFSILSIILLPLLLWQAGNLVCLVQTPKEAVKEAVEYVAICSAGIPFVVAYNVISSILRGLGDSKTPMYFIGIACIVNVILDLVLAGAAGLGTAGTAVATVTAQAVSSVYAIWHLKRHGLPFLFTRKDICWERKNGIGIFKVGLPIASQDFLIQISFMVITVIANQRGLVDSAAVGVVEKIIHFAFLVPSAFLSAISAITAQNAGAGKEERAVLTLKYGIGITVAYGSLVCLASQLIPELMTGCFSTDGKVIRAGAGYLRSYSVDCILAGIVFSFNGYLCGMGRSLVPFLHNVASIFLIRIPLAYFASSHFSKTLLPMGFASPMGSLFSFFVIGAYFFIVNLNGKYKPQPVQTRRPHTTS